MRWAARSIRPGGPIRSPLVGPASTGDGQSALRHRWRPSSKISGRGLDDSPPFPESPASETSSTLSYLTFSRCCGLRPKPQLRSCCADTPHSSGSTNLCGLRIDRTKRLRPFAASIDVLECRTYSEPTRRLAIVGDGGISAVLPRGRIASSLHSRCRCEIGPRSIRSGPARCGGIDPAG